MATVSFSQSKFSVMENEKAITIKLVRSGDTSTEAVVLIGTHSYKGSATGQWNGFVQIAWYYSVTQVFIKSLL